MKFYGLIAAGVCTILLRFEPDPDHSPKVSFRMTLSDLLE